MPRHHRDHSNRRNLERNLGTSIQYESDDDYSLYKRDIERLGGGRNGRPIVDQGLERDVDHVARVYHAQNQTDIEVPRRGGHAGKGPKGYQRSDDRIREDVCEALYESYDVDASGIEVEVKDACVYLRGEVEDRLMKRMAEDAVENLRGVVDVRNELSFKRETPVIGQRNSVPENELGTRLS